MIYLLICWCIASSLFSTSSFCLQQVAEDEASSDCCSRGKGLLWEKNISLELCSTWLSVLESVYAQQWDTEEGNSAVYFCDYTCQNHLKEYRSAVFCGVLKIHPQWLQCSQDWNHPHWWTQLHVNPQATGGNKAILQIQTKQLGGACFWTTLLFCYVLLNLYWLFSL